MSLVAQAPPTNLRKEVSLGDGVYVCGDHRDTATFDGGSECAVHSCMPKATMDVFGGSTFTCGPLNVCTFVAGFMPAAAA